MFTVKCVEPAYFDVDSTLIEWRPTEDEKEENGIDCEWAIRTLSMDPEGRAFLKEKKEEGAFIPHRLHVEQLKEHKRHGHTIVVWSAGGWRWAEQAVKMLGLEDYVDVVMDKPKFVYDDKSVTDFMPAAQYISDKKKADRGLKGKKMVPIAMSDYEIAEDSPSPMSRSSAAGLTRRS